MLTVKQLFQADGLDASEDEIKLVRHVDHLNRSIKRIVAEGHFDRYQREQVPTVNPFHRCKVILSFLGLENNKAEFYGAYRVRGSRPFRKSDWAGMPDWLLEAHKDKVPRIYYDLGELTEYQSYRKRLIVQWKSTRGWHQKKDLDIYEILPASVSTLFPGYQEVLLRHDSLKAIFADPRAHRDWQAALKANAGIYRIVDLSDGKIYIGSAYGSGGLWGRWQHYAKTGHGGNTLLKGRDPKNFQWSIVRTVSTTMSERDVIRIEALEKQKHGSRAIGLNAN
ncbi:MAG: hypothetical protein GVY36_04085 [Verrucomicrobia bacterium]|jgi:hypothetical protein|nr:hypothetical protein [Verrucomicrobiota bacterium]